MNDNRRCQLCNGCATKIDEKRYQCVECGYVNWFSEE